VERQQSSNEKRTSCLQVAKKTRSEKTRKKEVNPEDDWLVYCNLVEKKGLEWKLWGKNIDEVGILKGWN
jgi:hypothetical protein